MDGHPLLKFLCYLAGAAMILLALADVFMTVLYARAGTGPISHRLSSAGWAVIRRLARITPRYKDAILSYFGPSYLVLLMSTWAALLVLGFTLLAWPALGTGIQSQAGQTPRDFLTAFYYAGGSLTTVGSGDLRPVSALYKFLTVIDSILGISVLTLALTYVIQIYTALHGRNALVVSLHHASGGSGDAASLLIGLGAGDDFSRGDSQLANFAADATGVYESHHFYSALTYFRFSEPHYAMARGTLMAMELVTLIESALDERRHGWLRTSSAVTQLREANMHAMAEFAGVYLPGGPPKEGDQARAVTDAWRRRYRAAVELLRRSGIAVTTDLATGADRYVELRRRWDPYVIAFAQYMEHDLPEIDPTGADPAETGHHREMPTPPLREAS